MGTILTDYGDAAYEHEGYAGQLLDDGSVTSTYSDETRLRMVGVLIGTCSCGWRGTTRYPATPGPLDEATGPGPWDEAAEEMALAEWEHQHAVPALRGEAWERLRVGVRRLAESHATTTRARFTALTPEQQRAVLDRSVVELTRAIERADQLRRTLGGGSGG